MVSATEAIFGRDHYRLAAGELLDRLQRRDRLESVQRRQPDRTAELGEAAGVGDRSEPSCAFQCDASDWRRGWSGCVEGKGGPGHCGGRQRGAAAEAAVGNGTAEWAGRLYGAIRVDGDAG